MSATILLFRILSFFTRIVFKRNKGRFIADFREHMFRKAESGVPASVVLCRKNLARDRRESGGEGYGAGSRIKERSVRVADKALKISVKPKTGMLLYRLAKFYRPDTIIELGTAFGISTLYMAEGNPDAQIVTVEGNSIIAGIALENFRTYNKQNIRLINSRFDDVLDHLIDEASSDTMVFIDGNHTFEATLKYYRKFAQKARIIVFDDILWSADMIRAWKTVTKEDSGTVIDMLRLGILYTREPDAYYYLWN